MLFAGVVMSGCAVSTAVTNHYTPDAQIRGSIAVVPINIEQKESLAFERMSNKLEEKLIQIGYFKTIKGQRPDFFAVLNYAIDNGRATLDADGQPTLAFTREIRVNIFDNKNEKPRKVYEISATSVGSCRSISAVLPYIFDAVFKNFPGENGVTEKRIVQWDGKC